MNTSYTYCKLQKEQITVRAGLTHKGAWVIADGRGAIRTLAKVYVFSLIDWNLLNLISDILFSQKVLKIFYLAITPEFVEYSVLQAAIFLRTRGSFLLIIWEQIKNNASLGSKIYQKKTKKNSNQRKETKSSVIIFCLQAKIAPILRG